MLTEKQEKFCNNIVAGMTQIDAYKGAYECENMSDDVIYVKASELAHNGKVMVRIKELRDKASDKAIMTAIERQKWLTDVVIGNIKEKYYIDGVEAEKDATLSDKMKAIDTLNKMTGEYITKISADLDGDIEINIKLDDE